MNEREGSEGMEGKDLKEGREGSKEMKGKDLNEWKETI